MAGIFEWCPWLGTWVSDEFPCNIVACFKIVGPGDWQQHEHSDRDLHGKRWNDWPQHIRTSLINTYKWENWSLLHYRNAASYPRKASPDAYGDRLSCAPPRGPCTAQDSVERLHGYGLCHDSNKVSHYRDPHDSNKVSYGYGDIQDSLEAAYSNTKAHNGKDGKIYDTLSSIANTCKYCYLPENHLNWCPSVSEDQDERQRAEARWASIAGSLRQHVNNQCPSYKRSDQARISV